METTPLGGLTVLEREPNGDSRGFFERLFCSQELSGILLGRSIVQINQSLTAARGSMRGLHFQYPPHADMKIVSCLRGEVFDVAVDLRRDSPTFLRWHAQVLSESNHRSLSIPEGFAHGFQALADDCAMLYLHTAAYRPEAEGGLHLLDPRLNIAWPLAAGPLSPRDASWPLLQENFAGIAL